MTSTSPSHGAVSSRPAGPWQYAPSEVVVRLASEASTSGGDVQRGWSGDSGPPESGKRWGASFTDDDRPFGTEGPSETSPYPQVAPQLLCRGRAMRASIDAPLPRAS